MAKNPHRQRHDHPRMVEFDAVRELLRRIQKYAPQVRADLHRRVSSETDEHGRQRAVADWARRWHLCDRNGPTRWALLIGADSAKDPPESNWNMSGYWSIPIDSPEGYDEIKLPALTVIWRDQDSRNAFEGKLCKTILDHVRPQIQAANELRQQILTPRHHVDPDRAFTFLMRFQVLEENYSDLATNPQKYREEPDDWQHQVPNVKRDIKEAARQAGLEPRPSRSPGRPPNTKERGMARRRERRGYDA